MAVPLSSRLRSAFVDRPLPDAVFELAPGRLSGVRVAARRRTARARFMLPLPEAAMVPSFDRPNLADVFAVRSTIERGKEELGLGGGTVSLLIPETCVRVFILAVESLPGPPAERESFIRWRVGKQMPVLPDDLRLATDIPPGPSVKRVMVAAARDTVVREYEELFEQAGMRVGTVTVPSLSLVNLVGGCPGTNGILLNVDAETLSLLAVMESDWTLYRQKMIGSDSAAEDRSGLVAQEVENTVHFIEDKERQRVEKIWVRSLVWEEGAAIISRLNGILRLPAEFVDYTAPGDWDEREKAALAPLMGQIA